MCKQWARSGLRLLAVGNRQPWHYVPSASEQQAISYSTSKQTRTLSHTRKARGDDLSGFLQRQSFESLSWEKLVKIHFDSSWKSCHDVCHFVSALPVVAVVISVYLFAIEVLTCRQGKGHQVCEEIAGEVSLALVEGGRYLTTDLLR